ncbi:c-type cytochrome biogenesis protein CcmI [Hydrogenophaga sp.]|uniref:c-type cytochrome biogenesis protein CcmI n=1 Tax=Hydrogenophaga sp. TaxID=1904254 RepID=UPI00271F8541|nr:c-type cytochrome biogenesis protein CcmI [Hydrogenophaga sp.]MDO8906706.1 c-type cytochrome biogenesis protein CcmI [Hydrogenophaga sp.]
MTLFVVLAVSLVLITLWPLARVLLRQPAPGTTAGHGSVGNLTLLHAQRAQNDADRAAGRIGTAEHAQAQTELARRVLEESAAIEPVGQSTHRTATLTLLLLIVPAFSVGLYARLGEPGAIRMAADNRQATTGATLADVDAMVRQMAQQLENRPADQPADAAAWEMLARSQAGLQRYADADRAYQRAIELAPDNPRLLADRADLLTMLQGQNAEGEPMQLITRALAIDPNHPKALALAGSAAYGREDFAAAQTYWQRARQRATPGSDFANGLDRSLEAARSGMQASGAETGTIAPAFAGIQGRVEVAPALRDQLREGDTLYITARTPQGPRLPLAVLRMTASAKPTEFTLTDQQAMSDQHKLSGEPEVVVEARISRSGNALPQGGDLSGRTQVVAHNTQGLRVLIDQVLP